MLVKVLEYNGTHLDVDMIKIVKPAELDFHTGVTAAVFVTIMSEMGDKSFFMSAILAMHHSQTLTFLGSVLGQAVMTVVAVVLGMAVSLVPEVYVKWASCVCMTFFGLNMLKEGFGMPVEDEKDKHVITLDQETSEGVFDIQNNNNNTLQCNQISSNYGGVKDSKSKPNCTKNPYGVAVGSLFGHIICSLTAVIVGRQLGQKFPVRTVSQAGGVVFLLCAASSLIF